MLCSMAVYRWKQIRQYWYNTHKCFYFWVVSVQLLKEWTMGLVSLLDNGFVHSLPTLILMLTKNFDTRGKPAHNTRSFMLIKLCSHHANENMDTKIYSIFFLFVTEPMKWLGHFYWIWKTGLHLESLGFTGWMNHSHEREHKYINLWRNQTSVLIRLSLNERYVYCLLRV